MALGLEQAVTWAVVGVVGNWGWRAVRLSEPENDRTTIRLFGQWLAASGALALSLHAPGQRANRS